MKTRLTQWASGLLALAFLTIMAHAAPATQTPPLANAVILIIRHAEKPDSGDGLTTEGQQRALAYVRYFRSYQVDGQPLHLDHLVASADSKNSERPRLTLEPLSKALREPIDGRFRDKDFGQLASALQTQPSGRDLLICWHHGEIPALLQALGADPDALLPHGKWPGGVFGWVIQLRYDQNGHLIPGETMRVNEHLLPADG